MALPNEVIQQIASFCSPRDYLAIHMASKRLHQAQFPMKAAFHSNEFINCMRKGTDKHIMALVQSQCFEKVWPMLVEESCPLVVASQSGRTSILKELLLEWDPTRYNGYCLLVAIRHGHLDVVRTLIQDGRIKGPFHVHINMAAEYGHTKILRLLLQFSDGCHPTAILRACVLGHASSVQLLLQELPSECLSPKLLVHAVMHGHFETVAVLLKDKRIPPTHPALLFYALDNLNMLEFLLKDLRVTVDDRVLECCVLIEAWDALELIQNRPKPLKTVKRASV
ncbi:hypothetical protein EDD86DRAFT_212473 [Gorgonomyces haynaldii]|nr:hypothetical protein EDD86DRAFT_212473 [Gorgonomyces haynaldii]